MTAEPPCKMGVIVALTPPGVVVKVQVKSSSHVWLLSCPGGIRAQSTNQGAEAHVLQGRGPVCCLKTLLVYQSRSVSHILCADPLVSVEISLVSLEQPFKNEIKLNRKQTPSPP